MTLNTNVQYLMDEDGNKTAVQIPIKDWNKISRIWSEFMELSLKKVAIKDNSKTKIDLTKTLAEFMEYTALKKSLSTAFQEVEKIKNGKIASISPQKFLDEL